MNPAFVTCRNALDHEADAIKTRDWAAMERLVSEKQAAFEQLRAHKLSKEHLSALKEKSDRNAKALKATQDGLTAALQRLAQIQSSLEHSQVYGPEGTVLDIAAKGASKLEKRS
ncbi:hypothetical protein [Nereida sp. MMG025]|uniref:hypothetical protein n=1 Tax=Nereida sp. MMG025 TaxID=2909981 RepID=UPI001F285B39|nr:hypothetical protein [Nereida sp. MMG025]MCF6444691.1 hypothetical protein [Nereida sp. MMG025]